MKYNFESSQSSQLALLIDFVRQNSEFYDQFDSSRIDLNGKTPVDKGRKQILFCKTSAKGFISANLFDIRTNETKHFSGFEALKDDNFYSAPKFYKSVPLKPVVKTPKTPAKTFNDWLTYYQALPVELPATVPYFSQKIGNGRLAFIDGLRVGKYFGIDAAIVPLRNFKGEIKSFQFFADKALIHDSNKVFCEGVKSTSNRFGADLETSKRQFIGEGAATLVSGFDVVKNDLGLSLETDCFINGLNAGNIKTIVSSNKESLTNSIFFADNDVIDATNPNKQNIGLLTAIESSFVLGVQNKQRILIPQNNGLKCDFNDIENKENASYSFLSAKEVLKQFELLNNNTIKNSALGLKEVVYLKNKHGDFAPITIKELIAKHIDKSDLTIQINRKNKTLTCELICNGKDYFLSATNEFALFFLPIEQYLFDKIRNGKTTYFNNLKESINLELNNRVNNQIDLIVSDLMRVDYRGAKEMIADKDNLEVGKYLPPYLARLDFATMFLPTPMGSGKSFLFGEIIKLAREYNPNISILTISPLVSLIDDLSRRLKLTKYSDVNGFETKQLITTLHSLIKHIERFENETGYLFLDEVNHILSLFNSTTLKCNTTDLFNRFKKLIKNAKKLYIADAYLSQQSIDFIAELRDMHDAIVIKYDFVETHNKSFQLFEHDSALDNEVLATIENNKHIAIVCSSLNKSEVISKAISLNYPAKKLLIINSETTGNIDVQNFLNNPNEEIRNYDVIIYSPAISGGVSFDDLKLTPDFQIFGYFMPFVHTANDFMQMLGRFRRKSDLKLFVDTSSSIPNELKPESLDEANKANILLLIELLETTYSGSDNEAAKQAVEVIKKEIEERNGGRSDLNDFVSELRRLEVEQKKYAHHILIKLLENAGYKNAGVVSGKNEDAAALSKEAKEAVISEKIDCIQKAQPIDEVEYNGLRKKHKRSTKEANQMKRFKIENRFKLDLNCENIKFVLTKENEVAAAYKASLLFLSDNKLIEKALKEIDFESNNYLPVVLRKYHLLINSVQTQIFGALNIKLNADGFDVDNSKPVTTESLSGCFEWIKTTNKNGKLTAAGFKALPSQPNNRIKWITDFLNGYGFGIDKSTKALRIDKPLIGKIAANLARKTR